MFSSRTKPQSPHERLPSAWFVTTLCFWQNGQPGPLPDIECWFFFFDNFRGYSSLARTHRFRIVKTLNGAMGHAHREPAVGTTVYQ